MQKHGIIFWILIDSLKNKVLKYLRFFDACKQKQYVQLFLRRIPELNTSYSLGDAESIKIMRIIGVYAYYPY